MPAVTILYPRNFFSPAQKAEFVSVVMQSVATHMDAIDPETNERTQFADDPGRFIDLVMIPYSKADSRVTTPLLATIVSYEWPDRMRNIKKRVKRITREVREAIPLGHVREGSEAISFTFIEKHPGAWSAA